MKTLGLFLISFILLSACSSTLLLTHTPTMFEELNAKLKNKECEIILTNGEVFIGKDLIVNQDSIKWSILNPTINQINKPTYLIQKINYLDKTNKKCKITLSTGDIYMGKDIKIGLDSTSWYEIDEGNNTIIKPISDIHKIIHIDHGSASEKGFALGLLTGGGVGYLIGK